MVESIISRAEILIQQKRYSEAEILLKDLMSNNPNDIHILILLSEAFFHQEKIDQSELLLNNAIFIAPTEGILFYMKSRIDVHRDKFDDAEGNLKQAIKLNPIAADYYSLWASIKLARKQFDAALALANKALELDSENILGLNTRSTALLKLNRKEDSFKTIEGALREDPNNAFTHANYGWSLLENGEYKKALEHFKEALKNDPNNYHAQSGMVEALKANNIFYKLFLKYSFWIGNLSAKYQWGVIIGFYLVFRFLKGMAILNTSLRPYLIPIIIFLAIVAFSTWIINPIGNLFLRFNKYGVHLLDKQEKMSSDFVGLSFLCFLIGLVCYIILKEEAYLAIACFGLAMMLPLGNMFSPSKSKYLLPIYSGIMAFIGIMAILIAFNERILFNGFSIIFIFGFTLFQWVANYILIKENNI